MKPVLEKGMGLAASASLLAANIAAITLLLLVALTCVDVVGRYVFSAPLVGAVELVRICMAGIIFFSVPLMFLRGDHIIVDLFDRMRRGWLGWVIALIFLALTLYVTLVLADRVLGYALRAFEDGDTTEYLAIPRFVVVGFIAASLYAGALMTVLRALHLLSAPGRPEVIDAPGEHE